MITTAAAVSAEIRLRMGLLRTPVRRPRFTFTTPPLVDEPVLAAARGMFAMNMNMKTSCDDSVTIEEAAPGVLNWVSANRS
ncbi:hypothetical protein GCM10010423_46130 [Streptomyces levis]|uniref:Uncharacterized protein n=1 Tax=Streptomyces levis TaxID=285566 RepID=A0ABN3NX10_9ACTN